MLKKLKNQASQISIDNIRKHLGNKNKRLAQECAKFDAKFEQQLADEGLVEDTKEWQIF